MDIELVRKYAIKIATTYVNRSAALAIEVLHQGQLSYVYTQLIVINICYICPFLLRYFTKITIKPYPL
jgi:hypothetical protein